MEKKDFRKLYEDLVMSDWFKKAYHDKSLGECPFEIPELNESEDERIRKELIEFIRWSEDRGMTRHDFHQAKRPSEWIAYLEKQKAEWSEEDEDFINMLILHFNYLIDKGGDSVETYKSYREKLKSLRPQPKQEWSGEDINDVIERLELAYKETKNEMFLEDIMRLKSIRPSWKPSEEQMEALLNTLHPDDPYYPDLKSLYEDLQKRYGTC